MNEIQQQYAKGRPKERPVEGREIYQNEQDPGSTNGTGKGYDLISRIESIPGTRFPLG